MTDADKNNPPHRRREPRPCDGPSRIGRAVGSPVEGGTPDALARPETGAAPPALEPSRPGVAWASADDPVAAG